MGAVVGVIARVATTVVSSVARVIPRVASSAFSAARRGIQAVSRFGSRVIRTAKNVNQRFKVIKRLKELGEKGVNDIENSLDQVDQNGYLLNQNSIGVYRNTDESGEVYEEIVNFEHNVNKNFELSMLHFQNIENKLNQALNAIEYARVEIIDRIDLAKAEILQSIKDSRTEPIVSQLNTIFNYFISESDAFNSLSLNERVAKLELPDGILQFLQHTRIPQPSTLYSLLSDIINEKFAIPTSKDDKMSLVMLELLCYGMQVYTLIIYFIIQQYTLLAQNYYYKNDFEKYNKYYLLGFESFKDFSNTLITVDKGFIDKVTEVLKAVKNLDIIHNERPDVIEYVNKAIENLHSIRENFNEMSKSFVTKIPNKMDTKLNFAQSRANAHVSDDWKSGRKVSYAIQYLNNETNIPSMISEWSTPYTISEYGNPVVKIEPEVGKTRIVFRKFDSDKPQIVAIVTDSSVHEFSDVNRDLYNAAFEPNEAVALKNVAFCLENGANPNAVFEHEKRAIHAAAENDNWSVAQALIRNGSLVDVRDADGHSPLFIAAEAGYESFLKGLIQSGNANVNVKTNKEHLEMSPLHSAAYKGHKNIVQFLMQTKSVDVNVKNVNGFTPLHFAASFGKADIVSLLIGDNRTLIDSKSVQSLTPLHLASINNRDNVVQALLNASKVNVNAKGFNNVTPLHLASLYGSAKVVTTLINKSADLNAKTSSGSTVLHYAVFNGNENIVSSLRFENIIDAQDDHEMTPLYVAYQYNNTKVADKLNQFCANLNIHLSEHKTLLHLAAASGDFDAVQRLIEKGISVQSVDIRMRQPLHYAVECGLVEIARLLLENGASPNALDIDHKTPFHLITDLHELDALNMIKLIGNYPQTDLTLIDNIQSYTLLHLATELGYISVVKYLLEKGAKVDVLTKTRLTPLHLASRSANLELVKLLLDKGASINAYDELSNRPLHYLLADSKVALSTVKYFVDKGANINYSNNFGQYPIFMAARNNNEEVIKYLIDHGADYYSSDSMSVTPYHELCRSSTNLTFVQYFYHFNHVSNGLKDGHNKIPLYYAIEGKDNFEIVKYLSSSSNIYDSQFGRSPVFEAVAHNRLDVVKYLIEVNKLDFISSDSFNTTPLHECARQGNLDIAKLLLSHGASKTYVDSQQRTPLFVAVEEKADLIMIKHFIETGFAVNVIDLNGSNLVHAATAANKTDIAMYLINEKKLDFKSPNKKGVTTLHNSAAQNNLKLVEYFLENGLSIDMKDSEGKTPLYHALGSSGDLQMIKLLHSKGANIKQFNGTSSENPIILSIINGKVDVANYLIEQGGDYETRGKSEHSALQAAALVESIPLLKMLLDKDAYDNSVNANNRTFFDLLIEGRRENLTKFLVFDYKDKDGQTMLHETASRGKTSNVKFLLERGAKVNAVDGLKNTPLHLAALNGHLETVTLLSKQICVNIEAKNIDGKNAFDLANYNHKHNVAEYLSEKMKKVESVQFIEQQAPTNDAVQSKLFLANIVDSLYQTFKNITERFSDFVPEIDHSMSHAKATTEINSEVNVDINGSLILLNLFVRSKTGKQYISSPSAQAFTQVEARTYALNVVEQFENVLVSFANKFNFSKNLSYNSFEMFQTIERCSFSGEFAQIEKILQSQALNTFSQIDKTQLRLLNRSIDKLLIETQINKQHESQMLDNTQTIRNHISTKTSKFQSILLENEAKSYLL